MPKRLIRLLKLMVKWLFGYLTLQELLIHFVFALLTAWLVEIFKG